MQIAIDKIADLDYLDKKIDRLKDVSIYLYGAGSFGKEMCLFLEDKGIKIKGFLDKRSAEIKVYCGYSVYNLYENFEDDLKENALVLFSIVMDKEKRAKVIEEIRSAGFKNIEEAQFYRSLQIMPEEREVTDLKEYYTQNQKNIENAYNLLEDNKSKNIFLNNIKSHFQKEFSGCELEEDCMDEQYFPLDIIFKKGYGKFVDCGAFVGDTVESLFRKKLEIQEIIAFEPDMYNYKLLTESIGEKRGKVMCFPCAVSDNTGFQKFSSARGSGTLSENGENTILAVSLDEALHNFAPTFIKMDIEGAERKAILGAKRTICDNVPDMAICVYHNINHLWDIILLLNSWNLGYKFYLRSYNAFTMETVLYATMGEN